MNYAFIMAPLSLSPTGGIKVQALMWKKGLEKLGHSVTLVNFWETYNWESYDVILVFGLSESIRPLARVAARYTNRLAIAPIIDPQLPVWAYKILTKYHGNFKYLHLSSKFHDLWLVRNLFKAWIVRSDQEANYVKKCFEIENDRIVKIPLHFRIDPIDKLPEKEDFCLHVSRLDEKIKNVERLIKAAKKYNFKLVLAGNLQGEKGRKWLNNLIVDSPNIEYLGLLDDQQLKDVYSKAKVFALPSLVEGVGMVALEAGAYGSEIVLTNYGAPKEYYDGRALLVDPKDVDQIGKAVVKAMKEGHAQPSLKSFIEENYSEESCMKALNSRLYDIFGTVNNK